MNFRKEKVSALSGNTECRYTHEPVNKEDETYPPFMVIADQYGIRFAGASPIIKDMQDLQDYAELISKAWVDHNQLKVKIEVATELPQ